MKKIIINPNINLQYSAFYINGLQTVFGKKNVSFANKFNIEFFFIQKKHLHLGNYFADGEICCICSLLFYRKVDYLVSKQFITHRF